MGVRAAVIGCARPVKTVSILLGASVNRSGPTTRPVLPAIAVVAIVVVNRCVNCFTRDFLSNLRSGFQSSKSERSFVCSSGGICVDVMGSATHDDGRTPRPTAVTQG
jgi:hypothetical protein